MRKWLWFALGSILLAGCQQITPPAPDSVGWWWAYGAGDYIRSQPVIEGHTLYLGADDNQLHAVGKYTGAQLWHFQTDDNITALATDEQGIYFGSWDGAIRAVDKHGKLRWQHQTGGWVSAAPLLHRGLLLVGSHDHRFYALSSQSGEPVWQYLTNAPIESRAVFSGDLVIFASTDGYLHALDVESGERVWHFRAAGGIVASPIVAGDVVYFGSLDHRFYALDSENGQLRWHVEARGAFVSTPVYAGGVVFAAADGGQLYALDSDDGAIVWQRQSESLIRSSLVVWKDLLFAGTDGGTLLAFDLTSGEQVWRYQVGGMIVAGATIADDVLYVGSTARQVQAIVLQVGEERLVQAASATDSPHAAVEPLPDADPALHEYLQLWAAQAAMPSVEAVRILKDLIAFRPQSAVAYEAHVTLARHYARHSEPAAEEQYRAALALEDGDALRLELAHVLEVQGQMADAYAEYRLLLGRRPDSFAGMRRTGGDPILVAQDLNDALFYSDALETLEGVEDPRAWNLRGHALLYLGRYDESYAAYQSAVDANPNDKTARFGLALALAWLGRGDEALEEYRRVDTAQSRQNQAQLLAAEEPERALELYIESPNPSAWWAATTLLESQGRLTETLPLYARLAATPTVYTDDAAYRLYVLGQRLDDAETEAEGHRRLADLGLNWLALRADGGELHLPFSAPVDSNPNLLTTIEALEAAGHNALAHRELRIAAQASAQPEVELAAAQALMTRGEVVEAQQIAEQYIREHEAAPREFWELSYPRPYSPTVNAAAAEFDVDPLLIWAVMREESRFDPDALSVANARGLMQFILPTQTWAAEMLGLEFAPGNAYVPETSIRMGAWLLRFLTDYFDGDVQLAILAYNAGAGSVEYWQADERVSNRDDLLRWIAYGETRLYIKRVALSYEVYKALYAEPQ